MSRHRPFRPLGELQLDAVRTRIERRHEDWHRRWFLGDVRSVNARCEPIRKALDPKESWIGYELAGKLVYARFVGKHEPQILTEWIGSDEPPRSGNPVSSRIVVRRVLGDWISRFTTTGAPGSAHEREGAATVPPAGWTQPFSGAVKATLDTWFGGLEFMLDPALVNELQPPRPQLDPSQLKCAARSVAVRGGPVAVEISCGVAHSFSLRSLEELQVGDVVLLNADAADPWKVIVGGQEIALGNPGRVGNRRAVSLKNRSAS